MPIYHSAQITRSSEVHHPSLSICEIALPGVSLNNEVSHKLALTLLMSRQEKLRTRLQYRLILYS